MDMMEHVKEKGREGWKKMFIVMMCIHTSGNLHGSVVKLS